MVKAGYSDSIIIKNGTVFNPGSHDAGRGQKLDILVKDGRIKKISANLETGGGTVIDAGSLFVIPGLVDLHCHLRDPGETRKETLESGARAAAKGGVTTLLAMPNTEPPIDNPGLISALIKRAAAAPVRILFASCMTKERKGLEIVNLRLNRDAGCAAFSDDGSSIQDIALLAELCRKAYAEGVLLLEHPEIKALSKNNPVSYGKVPSKTGLPGQPAEAESLAVWNLGTIAGLSGARVHFTHISTSKSVEAVKNLKEYYKGLITCDATPHHLLLSENSLLKELDANKKMNPPLRPEADRIAIEQALLDGTIDAIATDHAPHMENEKNKAFAKAPSGTIGLETFLASTYTHLVRKKGMKITSWLRLVSLNPSRILGLPGGLIKIGARADLTLFNPAKKFHVNRDNIESMSKNSAFLGMAFNGTVEYTISGGKIAYPFLIKPF